MFCHEFRLNSASVAGITPYWRHWKRPAQSPVSHRPRPEGSNEHPVRAQNRPFHLSGTTTVSVPPAGSTQPVAVRAGRGVCCQPAIHSVWVRLLTNVNSRCPLGAAFGGVGAADRGGETVTERATDGVAETAGDGCPGFGEGGAGTAGGSDTVLAAGRTWR